MLLIVVLIALNAILAASEIALVSARRAHLIHIVEQSTVDVDGAMRIHEVKDARGFDLPAGEYETLAGFLLNRMGRIPQVGEAIR